MKPLLLGGRASSAVPARSTLASLALRLGAWARESLVARGIAILLGLGVLGAIGGSAVAGGGGPKLDPASAPSASATAALAAAGPPVDAGAIPTTRPELLPRAPPESPASVESSTATASAPATRATPDDPVDLDAARVDDLRRLPGVGAKRAEAILALRARLPGGRFRQIEDLLKVKGVGRAMLRRLHPLVHL